MSENSHLTYIPLKSLQILIISLIYGNDWINANPFPQSAPSHWIIYGGGRIPSTIESFHQFPQWSQLKPYAGVGTSGNCYEMGVPCSGHTKDSCTRYCLSVGFTFGTCDSSCCLCTNTKIQTQSSDYGNHDLNQFLSTRGTLNGARPESKSEKSKRVSTQSSQSEDLDVAESRDYLRFQDSVNNNNGNNIQNRNSKHQLTKSSSNFRGVNFNKSLKKNQNNWANSAKNEIEDNGSKPGSVCKTEGCLNAARRLDFYMNRSVDPCTNFYEYACGGFVQKTNIPRDESEVNEFNLLRNKVYKQLWSLFEEKIVSTEPRPFKMAKILYKSCMNTKVHEKHGTTPLVKEVLEVLGSWPVMVGQRWQAVPQHLYSWSNYLVWLRELGFSHDIFMKISVEPDIKNVEKRLLTIGEPSFGLARESLILGMGDSNVKAYYKYMVDSAVLLGAPRSSAETEMKDALNFEITLAKSVYRPKGQRGSTYYLPVTIAELERKHQTTPWLDLFQRLILSDKVSINSNEVIMVSAPQYVDAFFKIVTSTDLRTIANYAMWRVVSSSVSYLNEAARRLQFEFSATTTGKRQRVPRWKECSETVALSMGNAVGAMYIRRYFDPNSKLEAEEMIKNIHGAFLSMLDETDWMDESTRRKAKDKALAMGVHVGYPKEHLGDRLISELYAEYDFDERNYLGNIRNLVISATTKAFGKLRTPIRKGDWVVNGKNAAVNAFYLPLDNSMQFPAGILQNPFFDKSRPKYLNYGAIGWVVGHEITHGFDDQGHQFDKNGNFGNWWDPFTKKTYTDKTQCIIQQYGNFSPAGSSLKINGVNSQGENIADNGGIKQAYRGYQSWVQKHGTEKTLPGFENFSPNQLFWVSAASNWCSVYRKEQLQSHILTGVHSPGEFRVRGTFANNVDFAKDFSCPRGSPMNPVNKCSVW